MMDFCIFLVILTVWPTACASSSPGRDRQALDEEITKLNKDGFDAQLEGFSKGWLFNIVGKWNISHHFTDFSLWVLLILSTL